MKFVTINGEEIIIYKKNELDMVRENEVYLIEEDIEITENEIGEIIMIETDKDVYRLCLICEELISEEYLEKYEDGYVCPDCINTAREK